jgi:spore coat protein U-like protein
MLSNRLNKIAKIKNKKYSLSPAKCKIGAIVTVYSYTYTRVMIMSAYGKKRPVIAFATAVTMGLGMVGNVNQVIAGSDTANLTVTANVNATCKLSNSVAVAFGTYDPVLANASTPLDATGSFDIKCTKGSSGTMKLGSGLYNANAVGTTRALKAASSANYLNYDLYTSNARSTVWNDTTNTVVYGPAANASASTQTVYGRIPAAQVNAVADSYADTVVVTVTY